MTIPPLPNHIRSTYDAYASLIRIVQRFARKNDINQAEALVILFLGEEVMKASAVKEELLIFASNVSYTLASLEKRGFISSIATPVDRRCRFIKLTDKGLQTCASIRTWIEAYAVKEAA